MMHTKHQSYIIGLEFSNVIWKIIKKWDFFSKDTIGKQLARSADSISSNIAEGWHRYYKKEKILFFHYAKSSFYETIDWINKAINRGLISESEGIKINKLVEDFPRQINGLIKGTRENLKK